MTVSDVRGFGRQKGHRALPSGREVTVNFVPKIKIEVAVTEKQADKAVKVITRAARTGQVGDGKIFVFSLGEVVRIRTGETAEAAL
jgi:nitrogen regulatory protein PII